MTQKERKDLATKKRILDKIGKKNYTLFDKSGNAIYSRRTQSLVAAKRELKAKSAGGKTAAERTNAAKELALIEELERVFFDGKSKS